MVYIYIDESGDLGFSEKSSKHFVIAALITEDHLSIQKCITKVRKERLPKKYKKISELKYHNSSPIIRRRILECISKTDVQIAYVVLRKYQVYDKLRNKQNVLYNFLCGSLIYKIFQRYDLSARTEIVVDRSLTKINRDAFNDYVAHRALYNNNNVFDIDNLEINHVNSTQDKCVQVVDFVAGSIARKYNNKDISLYTIIDGNIEIALDFFNGQTK